MSMFRFQSASAQIIGPDEALDAEEVSPSAKVFQNLLVHIPGEASGLYLTGVELLRADFANSKGVIDTHWLWLVFFCSLIVLVLVRYFAKSSPWVIGSSVGAFVIWMTVFENGAIARVVPDSFPTSLGLFIAFFYSAVITILASAGKIR